MCGRLKIGVNFKLYFIIDECRYSGPSVFDGWDSFFECLTIPTYDSILMIILRLLLELSLSNCVICHNNIQAYMYVPLDEYTDILQAVFVIFLVSLRLPIEFKLELWLYSGYPFVLFLTTV